MTANIDTALINSHEEFVGNDTTVSRSDQIHSCFQSQHKISQVINRIIEFNSIDFVEMGYHSTKFHRLHYFEIHNSYNILQIYFLFFLMFFC